MSMWPAAYASDSQRVPEMRGKDSGRAAIALAVAAAADARFDRRHGRLAAAVDLFPG